MSRCAEKTTAGPSLLRALPALSAALAVSAVGEAVGYALGEGDAAERVSRFEFRRDLHVTDRDRRAMGRARASDSSALAIVIPALGPSFGVAPSGTWR